MKFKRIIRYLKHLKHKFNSKNKQVSTFAMFDEVRVEEDDITY